MLQFSSLQVLPYNFEHSAFYPITYSVLTKTSRNKLVAFPQLSLEVPFPLLGTLLKPLWNTDTFSKTCLIFSGNLRIACGSVGGVVVLHYRSCWFDFSFSLLCVHCCVIKQSQLSVYWQII